MSGGVAKSRPDLAAALLATAFVLAAAPARAEPIHGRLALQDAGVFSDADSLDAALGARDHNEVASDLRLTWEPTWDRWAFSLHYDATVGYGEGVRVARAARPGPPSTLFDLTDTFVDDGQAVGVQSIDRLSLSYSTPDAVVRVGRQALSWGSGLVFRPMDLFNPFSPTATDTEYKPGADMIYVQRLFADGSDLQVIVVPRPVRYGEAPSSDASSAAMHLRTTLAGRQVTWLVAHDHGDWVAAAGVSGALGGAAWNLELVPTVLKGGSTRLSAVANISYATSLMGRNSTVFAEYFHNGFGARDGDVSLATLPPELVDRLSRGQVFTTRRNYLTGGATVEVNPLVSVSPTLIANLDDGSLFLLGAATVSLGDNLTLIAGAQAPIGAHRTEFGGLPLAPESQTFAAPPARIYVQLRRYF
jgi:hypothetical protein